MMMMMMMMTGVRARRVHLCRIAGPIWQVTSCSSPMVVPLRIFLPLSVTFSLLVNNTHITLFTANGSKNKKNIDTTENNLTKYKKSTLSKLTVLMQHCSSYCDMTD